MKIIIIIIDQWWRKNQQVLCTEYCLTVVMGIGYILSYMIVYISNYFQIVTCLERYVAWNLHEPKEGVYDFNGNNDVESFIRMAQSAGLLVIVRAGGLMH